MNDVELLRQWIIQALENHPEIILDGDVVLTPLQGDAGARRYFSVNTQPPLLAVMSPPAQTLVDSAGYFSTLSSTLRHYGVPTPTIFACDEVNNRLLIEQFEGGDLYNSLSSSTADSLYGSSLLVLLRLQQVPQSAVEVVPYDETLLRQEMALFKQWFVGDLLQYALSPEEHTLIDNSFDFLVNEALSQPKVLVHRDYHSRNIIARVAEAPGIIDFQDAVWGPVTYDLVSLLRDCYIRWSPAKVRQWAMAYGNMAHQIGLLPNLSQEQFLQWFDTMGLQRHIKVLGIFARLSLRDGKQRYLADLPLVIRYTLEVANEYKETQAFAQWFEQRLIPLVEQQSWYTPYYLAGDRADNQTGDQT